MGWNFTQGQMAELSWKGEFGTIMDNVLSYILEFQSLVIDKQLECLGLLDMLHGWL